MKLSVIFSFLLLSSLPWTGEAQEPAEVVYDYALLKREYIGKNQVFTISYKNEKGKTSQVDGYIRASANTDNITVYAYNPAHRNYKLLEIPVSGILSISRSETQNVALADKPKIVTSRGLLKAVVVVVIAAGLALVIFHNQL